MSEHSPSSHGPVVESHDGSLGYPMSGHGAPSGHDMHNTGIAKYIYVFIALCLLTSLSFLTYSNWWRANFSEAESRMLMMAVSCTKALLVILCFMHIWWEANWKFVLTIPAMLMSIFLILMLIPDVGMRSHHASEERKFNMAEPKAAEPKLPAAEHPAAAPAS
ncbi:MAG TPA: cytochrome C oxidase subunit IV family protein [Pirellulales bacterium]|jgi:cytochrome c oxidase subunit 4